MPRQTQMHITDMEATVMDSALVVITAEAHLMSEEPFGVLEERSGKPIHTTAMVELSLSIQLVLLTVVALSLVIHEVSARRSPIMGMDLVMVETVSPTMPFPEDHSLQDQVSATTQEVLSAVANAMLALFGTTTILHHRVNLL